MKNVTRTIGIGCLLAGMLAGTATLAQDKKEEMPQLPPGMTEEMMQACIEAGTPGPMHERLAKEAGAWEGETTMWMYPGAEPMTSPVKAKVGVVMDGRYITCEMAGEMPGMGPFKGFGMYGYDNVAEKFVSTWVDNHSTSMMQGTGTISEDGKTITWSYSYHCPMTKKLQTMREVDRWTSENTKVLEMHGPDPATGEEYKMMEIKLTRTGKAGTMHSAR